MNVSLMLKGHDLFELLPTEYVDRISQFSSLKKFQRSETVYKNDDAAIQVFMLVKGLIHLRLPVQTAESGLIVSKVETGYLFGLAPLMSGQRYTAIAECAQDCKVLAIEATPLLAMLQEYPLLGYLVMSAVAKAYSERYMEMLKHLQSILSQIPVIG